MSEMKSIRIDKNLQEALEDEYPTLSFNETMAEIASIKNRRSRRTYRNEDVVYAIEQLQGYRKNNPKLSVEEIVDIVKEFLASKKESVE